MIDIDELEPPRLEGGIDAEINWSFLQELIAFWKWFVALNFRYNRVDLTDPRYV